MIDPWWLLAAFVLLAYTLEAVTGFGSIVIALSLGALFLPIETMLPVLVPLNICMTGYLVSRHHAYIHWPTLLRLILPLMVAGTLAGYFLRPWLGDQLLRMLFGALVVWFAGRSLWAAWRGLATREHSRAWTGGWMFMAGITHGLFASGGPLLVYALTGVQLDKARFRATLLTVWLSLNGLLTVAFALDGTLWPALPRVGLFLPVLVAGVLLGEWLHHRVDEQRFRQAVFFVLLVTGVILLLPI
jgi:uncharacterized membrane protein YfcA